MQVCRYSFLLVHSCYAYNLYTVITNIDEKNAASQHYYILVFLFQLQWAINNN